MLAVLKALWNLPGAAIDLLTEHLHTKTRKIHKGCGGHWRKQKRDGKSYERCLKCGRERRARGR
jgi:hypothetical protein